MRRTFAVARRAVTVLCASLALLACGGGTQPTPPPASSGAAPAASSGAVPGVGGAAAALPRRSASDSQALMAECYRGVTPSASVRSLEHTDVYCSKLYRRPGCARAWYELSMASTTPVAPPDRFDSKPYVVGVVERCRAEYCGGAPADAPALCTPSALTKASFTAFVTWLVLQELTLPEATAAQWPGSMYLGPWLQ